MTAWLWAAFIMGLAGSGHCLAMCGPLALSIPAFGKTGLPLVANRVIYHLGRVFSYLVLGLLFGMLGQALSLFVYQRHISIIAGVLLLVYVILKYFVRSKGTAAVPFFKFFSESSNKLRSYRSNFSVLLLGVLNGFLPCGFVYMAAVASLGMQELNYSVLFMLFFGLGTLPMLLSISILSTKLPNKFRLSLHRFIPYLALGMALLFILRGLALGIPYVSPVIKDAEKGKVESSCCHKKN